LEWSGVQTKKGIVERNIYWSELLAKRDGLE
jgi:hypothetical protein